MANKKDSGTQSANYDANVPTREAILAALRAAAQPLTADQLAIQLAVGGEAALLGFDRRIAAMERDGQIMPNRKGELLLSTKLDFVAGKVLGHRDGFGFLLRDDGGQDLFLSPREMAKVLHGDRVLVKPSGEFRGKPEGTIVEVIERRTRQLVGRFLNERGVCIVVPEDQRIKHDILIAPHDTGGAEHGQVVSVDIIEQPTRHSQPLGRVVDVLGEIDDPGMEIEIAVRKFDVPHVFSDAAQQQAEKLPFEVRATDLRGRHDLRDVHLVTIDGEDARDFDDAVYCEPIDLGTGTRKRPAWRLIVAIADVSHYVRPGDGLDTDALERSTSVYFPRRVIPMLPEKLSNGLCSLNPEVDRLALVCDMVIPVSGKQAGQVSAYQFYNAVIRSQARLTYTEVWAALSQPEGPVARRVAQHLPALQNLHALFQQLHSARRLRGAMDFETTETKIICNEVGRIEKIIGLVRNDAHRLIEECMLAANTCAADFMSRSRHPGLYRVHDGPSSDRLATLRQFLKVQGLSLGGGDAPQATDYATLLDQIRNRPDAQLLQTLCLRSMQQAMYSPDNVGHFGLAYSHYAHFTSPIRRYPDLLTHRVIKALIAKKRYQPSMPVGGPAVSSVAGADPERAVWERLGLQCSAHERRADEASRDVEAWLKCWYMRERVGEVFGGSVTGVAPFGVFVTLDELYVEGLVHVSELGSDYFQYNEAMYELRGERTGIRYRLTDRVRVQIARVDLESRRIEFRLEAGLSFEGLKRRAQREVEPVAARVRRAEPDETATGGRDRKARKGAAVMPSKPPALRQRRSKGKAAEQGGRRSEVKRKGRRR